MTTLTRSSDITQAPRAETARSDREKPSGGSLENIAKYVDTASDRRGVRYAGRDWLRAHSSIGRVRACGHVVRRTAGVELRVTEAERGRVAGWSGLATCGSIWVCPVCSAKILAERSEEVERAVDNWTAGGDRRRVGMFTFTMRHNRDQGLLMLWEGMSAAWRRMGQGRQWKLVRGEFVHSLRSVEVTTGAHGWHVHVHLLVFIEGGISGAVARVAADAWATALEAEGFSAVRGAQDYREFKGADGAIVRAAMYVTKGDYAGAVGKVAKPHLEMTRADLKTGRGGGRNQWELLRDLAQSERVGGVKWVRDRALWGEWEAVTPGKHAHDWSRGAREALRLGEARTDEEIAETETGSETDACIGIDARGWGELRKIPGVILGVLEAAESGQSRRAGIEAARRLLDRHDIEHWAIESKVEPQQTTLDVGIEPVKRKPEVRSGSSESLFGPDPDPVWKQGAILVMPGPGPGSRSAWDKGLAGAWSEGADLPVISGGCVTLTGSDILSLGLRRARVAHSA